MFTSRWYFEVIVFGKIN